MLLFLLGCAEPSAPVAAPPPAAAPTAQAPAAAPPAAAPVPAAAPEPDPNDPRTRADEAFNTAMRDYEGKSPAAEGPLRAALAAYQLLPDLDSDGQFHVALLQLALDDNKGARATAEAMLKVHPKHVFALHVAGAAAEALGDKAAARSYYKRVADTVDQPLDDLPEYQDHERLLAKYQQQAVSWLTVEGQ